MKKIDKMRGGTQMKKWVSALAILSLVAVSSTLIYRQAIARPMLCDTAEQMCWECGGNFEIIWCQDPRTCEALCYCEFRCSNVHPEYPFCQWEADFEGLCVR